MANNVKNTGKKAQRDARRELAQKKAKQKKMIIIAVVVVVVLAIAAFAIITAIQAAGTETYTDGHQTVVLKPNGTFTADLYHDAHYSGTYTMDKQGDWPLVTLTYGNNTSTVEIIEGAFTLPADWQDDHGHGSVLYKK